MGKLSGPKWLSKTCKLLYTVTIHIQNDHITIILRAPYPNPSCLTGIRLCWTGLGAIYFYHRASELGLKSSEEFSTLEVAYVNEQRLRAVLNQLARLTLIIPGERITPRLLCNLLISVKLYMDYCCCEIHVQQAALETSMSKNRN